MYEKRLVGDQFRRDRLQRKKGGFVISSFDDTQLGACDETEIVRLTIS